MNVTFAHEFQIQKVLVVFWQDRILLLERLDLLNLTILIFVRKFITFGKNSHDGACVSDDQRVSRLLLSLCDYLDH